VFFHLDGRYPNGISLPVYVDDYYLSSTSSGAFVEHPEYGMCFAEEKIKEDGGKERRYLRLHKMDYVLEEINRQLLENLNPLNIEARYPDYKNKTAQYLTNERTQSIFEQTREL
jgi:hypothetical protein